MTRVTAPIAKLTRSLSSTAAAPRPANLLNSASKLAASRARRELESGTDASPERHITTTHRPTPSPTRKIPLMQTFSHSSSAAPASLDTLDTLDRTVLPTPEMLHPASPAESDPFARLRVPLLPDTFSPNRAEGLHPPETPDTALAAPEILVVAADPDSVSAVSALTEVEGMGADGVELRFAHSFGRDSSAGSSAPGPAGGMLRDLWKGLVDDAFGESKGKPSY